MSDFKAFLLAVIIVFVISVLCSYAHDNLISDYPIPRPADAGWGY